MLLIRENVETGDLGGLESFLTAVVPVAISAGALVGTAFVTADAVKYQARKDASAQVETELLRAQTEQKAIDAQIQRQGLVATGLTQAEKLGLGAFALYLMFGRG